MTEKQRAAAIEFSLPGLPKTTNRGGRAHWASKAKEAKAWRASVVAAYRAKVSMRLSKPLERASLTLIRCSSSEPDFDGLVSSFKHVVDGLVDARIIVSDKPSCIGQPKYIWQRAPKKKGQIIVLVQSET